MGWKCAGMVLVLVLALGGCVTDAQRAEDARLAEEAAAAWVEKTRSKDRARCVGYGFTPGDTAFAQCMLQIASDRANADAINNAAYRQSFESQQESHNQTLRSILMPR